MNKSDDLGTASAKQDKSPIFVVMGVSGCGKSLIARSLADAFDLPFIEGDDYHSRANIELMSSGVPLTDNDRWQWLDGLNQVLKNEAVQQRSVFLSCSALKKVYRERLQLNLPSELVFIVLKASKKTLLARLSQRTHFFHGEALLQDQLDTLEMPVAENAVVINAECDVENIIAQCKRIVQNKMQVV